jgi:hypothetical protein
MCLFVYRTGKRTMSGQTQRTRSVSGGRRTGGSRPPSKRAASRSPSRVASRQKSVQRTASNTPSKRSGSSRTNDNAGRSNSVGRRTGSPRAGSTSRSRNQSQTGRNGRSNSPRKGSKTSIVRTRSGTSPQAKVAKIQKRKQRSERKKKLLELIREGRLFETKPVLFKNTIGFLDESFCEEKAGAVSPYAPTFKELVWKFKLKGVNKTDACRKSRKIYDDNTAKYYGEVIRYAQTAFTVKNINDTLLKNGLTLPSNLTSSINTDDDVDADGWISSSDSSSDSSGSSSSDDDDGDDEEANLADINRRLNRLGVSQASQRAVSQALSTAAALQSLKMTGQQMAASSSSSPGYARTASIPSAYPISLLDVLSATASPSSSSPSPYRLYGAGQLSQPVYNGFGKAVQAIPNNFITPIWNGIDSSSSQVYFDSTRNNVLGVPTADGKLNWTMKIESDFMYVNGDRQADTVKLIIDRRQLRAEDVGFKWLYSQLELTMRDERIPHMMNYNYRLINSEYIPNRRQPIGMFVPGVPAGYYNTDVPGYYTDRRDSTSSSNTQLVTLTDASYNLLMELKMDPRLIVEGKQFALKHRPSKDFFERTTNITAMFNQANLFCLGDPNYLVKSRYSGKLEVHANENANLHTSAMWPGKFIGYQSILTTPPPTLLDLPLNAKNAMFQTVATILQQFKTYHLLDLIQTAYSHKDIWTITPGFSGFAPDWTIGHLNTMLNIISKSYADALEISVAATGLTLPVLGGGGGTPDINEVRISNYVLQMGNGATVWYLDPFQVVISEGILLTALHKMIRPFDNTRINSIPSLQTIQFVTRSIMESPR